VAEKIVCNPEVFSSRAYPGEDKAKRVCFVIMPFKSETDEDKRIQDVYRHHILPVAKKCGLDCTRADDRRYFRNGKPIMEQIWKAICTADIIIGDFTTSNPNVTYEAGIAHTIGKPLIGIVQNMSDVPFDYRHLRFINYSTTQDGYDKLDSDLEIEITEYLKELEEEYPQRCSLVSEVTAEKLARARHEIAAYEAALHATEADFRNQLAQKDQALADVKFQRDKSANELMQAQQTITALETELLEKAKANTVRLAMQELQLAADTLSSHLIEPLPKVGDTYHFGLCEWLVLNVQEDRALLITKGIVEDRKYNARYTDTTWEKCTLRQLLNGRFYNSFGSAKQRIMQVRNENPNTSFVSSKGEQRYASGGNPTDDYIFLLSIHEAVIYFNALEKPATQFFSEKWCELIPSNALQSDAMATRQDWWLRSPGQNCYTAAYVQKKGAIDLRGYSVDTSNKGVRPALWLSFAE